ncbi:MAG: phosphoribosylformylglycinamidine synthase, partial [Gammaproteobacteria bacterium]|nr:phosphoribosylformylglycinamidine synthase [Gammaproteobacteria bacterium]
MDLIYGRSALSHFRCIKLLKQVQAIAPDVNAVAARYIHVFETSAPLDASEQAKLEAMLEYGPAEPQKQHLGLTLISAPRLGTISPWSSKATDIVRLCGLEKIIRIERGIEFCFACETSNLTDEAVEAIEALIHDRMVELVFRNTTDLDQL